MSDYTPMTGDVRAGYAAEIVDQDGCMEISPERQDEFDRWLRQERARVWAQGHAAGMDDAHPYNASHRNHDNPYEGG